MNYAYIRLKVVFTLRWFRIRFGYEHPNPEINRDCSHKVLLPRVKVWGQKTRTSMEVSQMLTEI